MIALRPLLDVIAHLPIAGIDAWLLWKYMPGRGGKLRKQPVDPQHPHIALNSWQKRAWSFEIIATALRELWHRDPGTNLWGTGFNFHVDHHFVGLDWDPPVDGRWAPLQWSTYTEASPSGRGTHAWLQTDGPKPDSRKFKTHPWSSVEIFSRTGFLTVTGRGALKPFTTLTIDQLVDAAGLPSLASRSDTFAPMDGYAADDRRGKEGITEDDVYRSLTDDEVLLRAASAANAEKFLKLWRGDMSDYANDHSVADLALVSILLFWTRGDRNQADRLFQQSNLVRPKWRDRADYRERTFDKAVSS